MGRKGNIKMRTLNIKRYDLVKIGNRFYIKSYDSKNGMRYLLKATIWAEAEVEAQAIKEKLQIENPNCIIVID